MPSTRIVIEIQTLGQDGDVLMARGHHDIHAFMEKARIEGLDTGLGVPIHVWMKTRPSREAGYTCCYSIVPEGTRGAWPATHAKEASGDACYEAQFPEMAETARA